MVDFKVIKALIKGLFTYIPGFIIVKKRLKTKSTHSCADAQFCYALWLSILVLFHEKGIKPNLLKIGELGNGGSFGVGICALLTGTEEYFSLEIENIFNKEQNLKLLGDIVLLFEKKTNIPKFNAINININNYVYPEKLIKPLFLQKNLISELRNEILSGFINSDKIRIISNWNLKESLKLDFIFSRAVMEHVYDPCTVYQGINVHLRNNAFMLHDIEFHSHGITKDPNGHFLLPAAIWKIIFGKRKFMLNRWNFDNHYSSIIDNGFEILHSCKNQINKMDIPDKVLNGATVLARKVR